MIRSKDLQKDLADCQMAVQLLKQLDPVFDMMLEQFPADWDDEWIDRLYWLIEQCQAEIDYSRDLLEGNISHMTRLAQAGSLSYEGQKHG